MSRTAALLAGVLLLLLGAAMPAEAAKIGELTESDIFEQAIRFFSMKDPTARYALGGALLLGISCGLLGSFIVVRRMALLGDALSHAVLPGVAMGWLWHQTKDPVAIFVGATLFGLLGTFVVSLIKQTTKLKEDAALGMVLAGFYAVGICLVTMIQRLPQGNKAGVDKFLFGQASAMGPDDLKLMAVVTLIAVVVLFLFYKEFLAISFDHAFAHVSGFPTRLLHYGMMLLLAFSVVIALQAVGVVLVSAMLITPAAAAYLLTDRLHRMLWLAALFGMVSGALGAFVSFLQTSLPTGPFMVLAASLVFGCAFLFAPRHGVVVRWVRRRSRARRVQRENTLKAIYHVLEDRDFFGEGVSLNELAERRRETVEDASQLATRLVRHGLATLHEDGDLILLTPEGMQRASAIVRNHRLWELYLTNAASIAADHVHEDAEKIEHVLGEETVRKLERRLAFATRDPHGRAIPSTADIQKISKGGSSPEEVTGYGRRS